jgi:hypothetical protein
MTRRSIEQPEKLKLWATALNSAGLAAITCGRKRMTPAWKALRRLALTRQKLGTAPKLSLAASLAAQGRGHGGRLHRPGTSPRRLVSAAHHGKTRAEPARHRHADRMAAAP